MSGVSSTLIHKTGCTVPGRLIPPASGMMRRAWWAIEVRGLIVAIADGRGGLKQRCTECGAIEGEPTARSVPSDEPEEPTMEQVLTLEAQLKADGRTHGVGTLAKVLGTSEATIRRRLGRIK